MKSKCRRNIYLLEPSDKLARNNFLHSLEERMDLLSRRILNIVNTFGFSQESYNQALQAREKLPEPSVVAPLHDPSELYWIPMPKILGTYKLDGGNLSAFPNVTPLPCVASESISAVNRSNESAEAIYKTRGALSNTHDIWFMLMRVSTRYKSAMCAIEDYTTHDHEAGAGFYEGCFAAWHLSREFADPVSFICPGADIVYKGERTSGKSVISIHMENGETLHISDHYLSYGELPCAPFPCARAFVSFIAY